MDQPDLSISVLEKSRRIVIHVRVVAESWHTFELIHTQDEFCLCKRIFLVVVPNLADLSLSFSAPPSVCVCLRLISIFFNENAVNDWSLRGQFFDYAHETTSPRAAG